MRDNNIHFLLSENYIFAYKSSVISKAIKVDIRGSFTDCCAAYFYYLIKTTNT